MPLESLGKDEKLNIKKVETPGVEGETEIFDARVEMTEEIWQETRARIIELFMTNGYNQLRVGVARAALCAQLFPEKRSDLILVGLFERLQGEISRARVTAQETGAPETAKEDLLSWVNDTLVLFPEVTREQLGVAEDDLRTTKSLFKMLLAINSFGDFLAAQIAALRIFPEHKDEFTLTAGLYEKLRKSVNVPMRADIYAEFAANLRLVFPDQLTKAEVLKLDQDRIHQSTVTEVDRYIPALFTLQVLAADRVEITLHGVEFVMPEKQKQFGAATPPIPETKRK